MTTKTKTKKASAPETRTFTCAYCSEPVRENDGHPCDKNRRKKYGYPPRFPRRTIPAEKPTASEGRHSSDAYDEERWKAHAAQLAEALADCLELGVGDWDGEEPSFIEKARQALAAYEESQSQLP